MELQEKKIFFFSSTKIKSNASSRSKKTFSLFSPETKSDNENRGKTILEMIADLIFLIIPVLCFPFSTDPAFTPAVLPLDILPQTAQNSSGNLGTAQGGWGPSKICGEPREWQGDCLQHKGWLFVHLNALYAQSHEDKIYPWLQPYSYAREQRHIHKIKQNLAQFTYSRDKKRNLDCLCPNFKDTNCSN